jgi:hypothetical protein
LSFNDADDKNTSFLLIVQTDGEENSSVRFKNPETLNNLIRSVQSTDRWSIAILVPLGAKDWFCSRFKIPEGNVKEWEVSVYGAKVASVATQQGLGSYFQSRSIGVRSTKSFFTTNLSKVKKSDVQGDTRPDGLRPCVRARTHGLTLRELGEDAVPERLTPFRKQRAAEGHCMSNREGDCSWAECPQLRDGEPERSGQHCPRDVRDADE